VATQWVAWAVIQWEVPAAWVVIRWVTWEEEVTLWAAWTVAMGTNTTSTTSTSTTNSTSTMQAAVAACMWEAAVTTAGSTHNLFTMHLMDLQGASQMAAGSSERDRQSK